MRKGKRITVDCNNHEAAAYFHTFLDGSGAPLDGSTHSCVLKFAKGQQPTAERFWSLTAYTPEAIELVQNKAGKYAVASYTPGLITAKDGSVTIVISTTPPADKKQQPNWLPSERAVQHHASRLRSGGQRAGWDLRSTASYSAITFSACWLQGSDSL